MQACKVGSSETHNLREKQLSYVVPEMSHLNESVILEHIPEALARIEATYTEVTGQNSAVRNSASLQSSSISTATKVTTTVPQRNGSRTFRTYRI